MKLENDYLYFKLLNDSFAYKMEVLQVCVCVECWLASVLKTCHFFAFTPPITETFWLKFTCTPCFNPQLGPQLVIKLTVSVELFFQVFSLLCPKPPDWVRRCRSTSTSMISRSDQRQVKQEPDSDFWSWPKSNEITMYWQLARELSKYLVNKWFF